MKHKTNITKRLLSVLLTLIMVAGLLPTVAFAATNVSGTVNASSLTDNDSLVLTGDTTLVMDVPKTLKSISGDYALTIEGSQGLIIT